MKSFKDSFSQIEDILIVDDTPANLDLLENILTGAGYQVRSASNGKAALRSVLAELPGLILLDIKMPGMDGFEVCRQLKEDERSRSIPVIFISILEDETAKIKGFQVGGVDYINKPFHKEEVLMRVNTHLTLHHMQLNLEERVRERAMELEQSNLKLRQQVDEHLCTLEKLRESEEKYRRIVDTSNEGIWMLDKNCRTTLVNEQMATLLGYRNEEMIGQVLEAFLFEEDVPDQRRRIENRRLGKGEHYERRFRRKDGQPVWTLVSATPVFDAEHHFNGSFAMFTDITEHKEAGLEREKLQAQLTQAQKMESVGRLAGGVAHDFNNILGVIIGYTEMLMMDMEPDNPVYIQLQEIFQSAQRAVSLTRQLLAFARKQVISPKILDINETVANMINMLHRVIGENIELIWIPGYKLWKVRMDPVQIEQVLANLAVNSHDAISNTGSITLETCNVNIDVTCVSACGEIIPGEYVLMKVSDTGSGMSEEIKEHIFDPFFTTKEIGKGTGLGLSTVYGIVRQNNGFIDVESEEGKGTSFKIYLPRFKSDIVEITENKASEKPQRGTETLLIAEDEERYLMSCKMMLEILGYTCLTANSPEMAINIAKTYDEDIDLLITDVVMPQMNGKELLEKIHEIRPGLKCLYMSGYTADIIARHGVLDEGLNFLEKPFSIKAIARKIREVLVD